MMRFAWFLGLIFILGGSGCKARINFDETLKEGKELGFPAVGFEQKVKISVKPTEGKVNVGVYLEKNKKAANDRMFSGGTDPFILIERDTAHFEKEVTIPANEEWNVHVVNVGGAKDKTIVVKVTN